MGTAFALVALMAGTAVAGLQPQVFNGTGGAWIQLSDGDKTVLQPGEPDAALVVVQPQGRTAVRYGSAERKGNGLDLGGGAAPGLSLAESWRQLNPGLVERTITVTANADGRYYLDMAWRLNSKGKCHSFLGEESEAKSYSPSCTGAGFGDNSWQTFPMVGYLVDGTFYGVAGDSPGLWENRSFFGCDPNQGLFSLATGDGSAERVLMIPWEVDSTSIYRARFDGWQHIEAGQKQTFTSWLFTSPARDQYGIQMAGHLALANAKGFNSSGLEAILRNTSYLLLRRNLLRPESDYIFISGVGYGWKQWVATPFG